MNLFQLILKQMRQRALSTWLTLLSVMLGTALATGIILLRQGGESIFVQREYGYDVIVGSSRGSPLQLVLNTVYNVDKSPGNFPYWLYESMSTQKRAALGAFDYFRNVRLAIPFARGDTYKSRPIIATTPKMFGFNDDLTPVQRYKLDDNDKPTSELSDGLFQYRQGEPFEIDGRVFHPRKFECVIGSEVASSLDLKIGSHIRATHGDSKDTGPEHAAAKDGHDASAGHDDDHHDEAEGPGHEEAHKEQWEVTGVLKPTGTVSDRCIYIPLVTFYCIPKHDEAQKAQAKAQMGQVADKSAATEPPPPYTIGSDGLINLQTPPDKWQLSGVLIRSRGGVSASNLMYHINNGGLPDVVAVNPAETMRGFFSTFLRPSSEILLMISVLVSVLAAVGILVSIYNSVAARNKEIAILRALGATRLKVLVLICTEAGLVGLAGALLGWVGGHAIAAIASAQLKHQIGIGFPWSQVNSVELLYLLLVVAVAVLAGLVPALKAYRTPVATNLVAS